MVVAGLGVVGDVLPGFGVLVLLRWGFGLGGSMAFWTSVRISS